MEKRICFNWTRNLFLSLFLVISLLPIHVFAEETSDEDTLQLTIMHMNDTHAHLDPMPQMFSAIKEVRQNHEHTLLLHGGDVFSGTLYFNEYKGQADLALMNLFGFDAMVYGNHEFDLGSNEGGHKSLASFVKKANFPLLGTNLDFTKDPYMASLVQSTPLAENPEGGKTYHSIVKEINGEKIGIFGLTTEDTKAISSPMSVEFANYLETAKEAVEMFTAAGINKVIAVTHLGFDSNPQIGNDLLLGQIDGIDVIVGGHTHTKLQAPQVVTKDTNGNNKAPTVIVQAGQYADNLGKLDVVFDTDGIITEHEGKLIPVTDYEKDPEASSILQPYYEKIEHIKNEQSGAEALKDLPNPRQEKAGDDSVRANETELGNLVTDAMLQKAKEKFPETVIAVQNGGGIRAPIAQGEITVGEIISVLPFGNDPVIVQLTGAELKEVLEHSVREAPKENGGFLHVSGMRFAYDSSKKPGERIEKMQVKQDEKFVDMEMNQSYTITTNQFTAQGGDGFTTFATAYEQGRVKNIGEIDWEQLRSYMVDYLNGKVDPVREGRIIDLARDEMTWEIPEEKPDDEEKPKKPDKEDHKNDSGDEKKDEDKQEDRDKDKNKPKPENVDNPKEDKGKKDKKPDKNMESKKEEKTDQSLLVDKNDTGTPTGEKLPNTATTMYTYLLLGGILLIIGTTFMIYRKYKANEGK